LISPSRGLFFPDAARRWRCPEFGDGCIVLTHARPEAITVITIVLGMFFINAGFYGWYGGHFQPCHWCRCFRSSFCLWPSRSIASASVRALVVAGGLRGDARAAHT
jgi:hypothetical protein